MVHFLKTLLQLQNTDRARGLTPPSPQPPLQLFLVSLALSQKWFRDFFFFKKSSFVGLPCSTRLLFLQNQRKSRHPRD